MESSRNGNGFRSSYSNGSDFSAAGMEVDSVDGSGSNDNGTRGYRRQDGNGNHGLDNVDIVVPPSTSSLESLSSQSRHSTGGSESDSRSFLSLFKRVIPPPEPGSIPTASCAANDTMYNMDHLNRGKCIIFNHCKFDKLQQLPDRTGSDHDVRKITVTFSSLGFAVREFTDCKFDKIVSELRKISEEDHSQNDCLVVFVLSHGQANELHAYDIAYKPSTLWDMFTANKCTTLAGKPKMFFIQACRGYQYDDGTELQVRYSRTEVDGPGDQTYRIPNQADFLTVFSTYEASNGNSVFLKRTMQYLSLGYYSWRNSKSGSCFIQSLCSVFTEKSLYKDVLSMLTLVNRQVALTYESRSKDENQNKKKQVPHVCHTLMREVYLLPKHRSTLV